VPLHGEALELVKGRIQGRGPEESLLGGWNPRTVSEWFNEACQEAKVGDGFTFHCLRHTFASHMLSRGVPIYKVSKIMGHSTVVVTEQHYGHLDRKVLSDEIHNIGSVMSVPTIESFGGLLSEGIAVVNKSSTRWKMSD
jgi:integrase